MRVSGRLDAYHADHLETELEEVIRSGEHWIELNLSGISFISSAGLGVLIQYYQILERLGGSLRITQASKAATAVLKLAGLQQILTAGQARPQVATESPGELVPTQKVFQGLDCSIFTIQPSGNLSCRLVGDPSRLEASCFTTADVRTVGLPPGVVALGVGAFGSDAEESKYRMGEFLAAGGAAVCLPSDAVKVPDYLLATRELVPRVQALYALVAEGQFSHCIRFSAAAEPTPLASLVELTFDTLQSRTIGLVFIAETAGLIGASLRRSPLAGEATESMFEHPGVRRWLSFTPERVFDRSLALVAGVATWDPVGPLTPFIRPSGDGWSAHFHAAAFAYRALKKGLIDLSETTAALFGEKSLQGVLHLLNDNREIAGAGQSLFVRGAIWAAPVASISKEGM